MVAGRLDLGWQALHVRGALREARDAYDAAHREAEQAGDVATMVQAAIGLGGIWVHEHRGAAEAALVRRRQRQALALTVPGSPEHLQLRLRMAAEDDYLASRHDRILAMLPEARTLGDPQVLSLALSTAHHCLLAPEHADTRRALADEMAEVATASNRPGDLTMALVWRTVDRFLDGDPHAERALADLAARLQRHPHLAAEFVVRALRVMLAVRDGRLAEAETRAGECARLGEAVGDLDAVGWFAAHLIAVRWYQGRIGELMPQLEAQAHSPALSAADSSVFGALAVAAASTGDQSRAALALGRLGGGDLHALPRSSTWIVAVYGAVEAAVLLGRQPVARAGYDLLLPYAQRPMMVSLAVACFGSVEHALGLAALGMGLPGLASRHLTAAVHADLALGNRPASLHARYRLGQALLLSDDRRDREAGAEEQAHALAEASRHGWSLPRAGTDPIRAAGPVVGRLPVPAPGGHRPDGIRRTEGAAPGGNPGEPDVVVHRHGGRWTLQWRGHDVEVDHVVGMLYLSVLLAHPGMDIPAADLAAGLQDEQVRADASSASQQHVVDGEARRTYRRRLTQLDGELRDARSRGDDAAAARLATERDWIETELSSTGGPSGRQRAFTSNAERARVAVGKAIRRALDRIEEADPVMGEDLRRSIRTGTTCSYQPRVSARLNPAGSEGVNR